LISLVLKQASSLTLGRKKRLLTDPTILSKAPKGQSLVHQCFKAKISTTKMAGKRISSNVTIWEKNNRRMAKRLPKNRPTGQIKQKTGKPKKKEEANDPANTA
jgi:hypothetical protein